MVQLTQHIKLYFLTIVFVLSGIVMSYSQTASSNRFKRIDYDYDLISGKVNKVTYQKDSADQFIQQYNYDSDNRITKVETSSDNVIWDVEAKYFYYAHGPLARTEYGDVNNQVQGVDYAYTLQGWVKGVNSNTLDKNRDMGQDGLANEIYDPANPQLHSNIAKDAFGYSLNYFKNDYKAVGYLRWSSVTNRFEASTTGSELMNSRNDLFNGNISSMVTTIAEIDSTNLGIPKPQIPKPLGNIYKYDQLNRIKKSVSYTNIDLPGNLWQSSGQTIANMYANSFTYDANGNILTQNRSDENGQEFEALKYNYRTLAGKLKQNRLYHVNDKLSYSSLKADDIDDQGHFASGASTNPLIDSIGQFNNYRFDEIGNLIKDKSEQIADIEWTVYGKVKRITRINGSAKDNLIFDYDANGNRVSKHVYDNGNNWKYSIYYVRDAQGNVLSSYENKNIPSTGGGSPSMSYLLQEQYLYGGSRIGINKPNKQLINSSNFNVVSYSHVLGQKQFEMGNHLGNVLSVISNKKIALDFDNDGIIDDFQAELLSSNDYSPFGVKLYNRGSSLQKYKYGYQGSEKDTELSDDSYTTEHRHYDAKLGRWLSIDPLFRDFPSASPFSINNNSPIIFIDKNGDCPVVVVPYIVYGIYALGAAAVAVTTGVIVHDAIEDAQTSTFVPFREAPPLVLNPPKPTVTTDPNKTPQNKPNNKPKNNPDNVPVLPIASETDQSSKKLFYITYTKTKVNDDGSTTVYSGRTSGVYKGEEPTMAEALIAVKARDLGHKDKDKEGYGAAVVDQKSTSYTAIRGREQQLIDFHGKAQSEGGTSGNLIRGVGKNNKAGLIYHNSANSKFGELYKYTGNLPTVTSTKTTN